MHVNKATDTPPDSWKANICLQPENQDSFLTKNNAQHSNSRLFLLLYSGLWFQWRLPPMNKCVLSPRWHNESEDLWTVKRDDTSGPTVYAAAFQFLETVTCLASSTREFNSPGNQQDATIPAIWMSFECRAPSHRQSSDASTVFKKRVRGEHRLCGATGTPDPKAPKANSWNDQTEH